MGSRQEGSKELCPDSYGSQSGGEEDKTGPETRQIQYEDVRVLEKLFGTMGVTGISMDSLWDALPEDDTTHYVTIQANQLYAVTMSTEGDRCDPIPLPEWVCEQPYCPNFDQELIWVDLIHIDHDSALLLAGCGTLYRVCLKAKSDTFKWDQCIRCVNRSVKNVDSFVAVKFSARENMVTVTTSDNREVLLNSDTGEPYKVQAQRRYNHQEKSKIRDRFNQLRKRFNIVRGPHKRDKFKTLP